MTKLSLKLAALALTAIAGAAQAQTSMKVVMDWAWEGAQSTWAAAGTSSCFPDKNLKVQIDRGFGSGDSISKVASGAYDIGVADFASIVAYNAQNPTNKLVAIYVLSELSPTSVSVLKSSGITKPKDLEGKRIADPQGEASRVLFPAFAKKNGIDVSKITWISVSPALRQTSVVQGQADAAAGHMFTVLQGMRAIGVKPEDVFTMPYAAYGVELPGNTVIAKPAYLAGKKKEMTDFLGCLTAGIKTSVEDPKGAIASLKKYNALADEGIELGALEFSTSKAVLTPYALKNGISQVDPARLDTQLAMIAETIGIAKPAVSEIWNPEFLPPVSERMIKAK